MSSGAVVACDVASTPTGMVCAVSTVALPGERAIQTIVLPGHYKTAANANASLAVDQLADHAVIVRVLDGKPPTIGLKSESPGTLRGTGHFKGSYGFLCRNSQEFTRYDISQDEFFDIAWDSFGLCSNTCTWKADRVALEVNRHTNAALTNGEADRILADASRLLSQIDGPGDNVCPLRLTRQGTVGTFSVGNGIINSQADYDALRAVPGNIKIVSQINFCGRWNINTVGCGDTPGGMFTAERVSALFEDVVWAHEYGHNHGLPHRDENFAVMNSMVGQSNRRLTPDEVKAYLTFPSTLVAKPAKPISAKLPARKSVAAFVAQTFVHGVSWREAARYDDSAVPALLRILADERLVARHANAVITLCFAAGRPVAERIVEYVQRPTGKISAPRDKAVQMAISYLGVLCHRTGDPAALAFLLSMFRSSAEFTAQLAWTSPHHRTDASLRHQLSAMAIWGLAYSGTPEAAVALRTYGKGVHAGLIAEVLAVHTKIADVGLMNARYA